MTAPAPAHPELSPIQSSMFQGQHYDPATATLHLQFKNGAVWRYDDVPMEKAETLMRNASPGSYFGRQIRGMYAGRKVAG